MPAQRILRRSPLVLSAASARAQAESPPPRPARSHRRLRQGCLRPSWFIQNTTTQTIPLFLTSSTFSGSTPAPYPFAAAHAHSPFQFLVDGDPLLTGAEPMMLLLFGTTAPGLGLAHWRRRGRGRAHAA